MGYGIETELTGYPRDASSLDDSALLYLYPLADKDLLAKIEELILGHGQGRRELEFDRGADCVGFRRGTRRR